MIDHQIFPDWPEVYAWTEDARLIPAGRVWNTCVCKHEYRVIAFFYDGDQSAVVLRDPGHVTILRETYRSHAAAITRAKAILAELPTVLMEHTL